MNSDKFKQTELGEIPEDWQVASLGGTATLNYGKSLPEVNRTDGAIPVFGSSGITGHHNQALVQEEGYIIGRKGTIGTIYYSPEPFYPIDTTYYVTKKDANCDFKYFYYLLKYLNLDKLNFDSAVPGLNRDVAYRQKYAIPKSINEQQQIASILSSLDDKIELNRKMNKTLEEIGKAIFKRWFVDFEFPNVEGKPYKSSGGKLIDSELGEIPEGWETKKIHNVFEINTKSINPLKKISQYFWHFSIPSYDQYGYPTLEKGEAIKSNKTLIRNKTILISKLNPKKEQRIWSVCSTSWDYTAISSTEFINFVPIEVDWTFANFLFRNKKFYNHFASLSTGSTGSRQRVKPTETANLELIYPNKEIRLAFSKSTNSLLARIDRNTREIMKLTQIRDSLLPRLMNGKMRVKV